MKKIFRLTFLLWMFSGALIFCQQTFNPPSAVERAKAAGRMQYLPADQHAVFSGVSESFQPKTVPGPSDWLAGHKEPGQSFDQFLSSRRNLLKPPRTKLYIQPLGAFPESTGTLLADLKEYAEIFFQVEVVVQKPLELEGSGIKRRINPGSQQEQILSTDVLGYMMRDLPADAYARIAVTMTDLYPADDWNFVFGQASYRNRVGVFSFARYGEPGKPRFTRRCIQIVSHETGHMFGIMHCIFYECVMNGSNHMEESDKAPLVLCPVCLRKMHTANAFPIRKRYQAMLAFFKKHKLQAEVEWMTQRLAELEK